MFMLGVIFFIVGVASQPPETSFFMLGVVFMLVGAETRRRARGG